MAFNATTVKPLTKLLTYYVKDTGTAITPFGIGLNFATPIRTAKGIFSDGTVSWFRATAGAGTPSKSWLATDVNRKVEIWHPGQPSHLTSINLSNATNIASLGTATAGIIDVSGLPGITFFLFDQSPIKKVKGVFAGALLQIRSLFINDTLDLSEVTGIVGVNANGSYATDILFPPAAGNPNLTSLDFPDNRIVDKDITIPAYPLLNSINFGTFGVQCRINTLDISGVPTLATLAGTGAGFKNIVYASGNYPMITSLQLTRNRFGGRSEYGSHTNLYGNGTTTGLIPLLRNAVNLKSIYLDGSGFSGTEIADMVTAIHTLRGQRNLVNNSKSLVLNGLDINYSYPAYNLSTTIANDAIVDTATRDKISDLIRQNWFISYIVPRGSCSYVNATTVRVSFATDKNVDMWAVGDTVTVGRNINTAFNGSTFTAGNYRIAASSPGGKQWDLEALPGNPALFIPATQSGAVDVDKPLSYKFKFGTIGYTDTAGNFWPFVSNGSLYSSSFITSNTQEPSLYNKMMTGTGNLTLTGLIDGNYVARCHFFDETSTAAGQRVFDVKFDGTTVMSNVDIYATAGFRLAGQKEAVITVTGGQTVLSLGAVTGTPVISAVELIRIGSTGYRLDDNNPLITYGGPWVPETSSAYLGGTGKYNVGATAWYEVTVPSQGGFTQVKFEGIMNTNGASFDMTVNGVSVGTGSMLAGSLSQGVYYTATGLVAGDVVRITKTTGVALFADLITLS